MINRSEMHRITSENDPSKIDKILDELAVMMLDKAKRGESSITIGMVPRRGVTFGKSVPLGEVPTPEVPVMRVMGALQDLGYDVDWVTDGDPYVPTALENDDGDGPLYVSWGVHISW